MYTVGAVPGLPTRARGAVVLSILAALVLFSEFDRNVLHVANTQWFRTFERDMESHVVGRLVKSRTAGVFSAGGLTGLGAATWIPATYEEEPYEYQYTAYLTGLRFGSYTPYLSQPGGQALLLGLLDRLLPWSSRSKLTFFRTITALLSAVVLSLIVFWFSTEVGLLAGGLVLASMAMSSWLVVFGRNLWWSLWAFYLPMVAVMFFLRVPHRSLGASVWPLAVLVFLSLLAKCFINGFEYITTTIFMITAPVVYYATLHAIGARRLLKQLAAVFVSSLLAVLVTTVGLCVQIASVKGSARDGVAHLTENLYKRTYAAPRSFPKAYRRSLRADPTDVVRAYLGGTFFDPRMNLSAGLSRRSPGLFRYTQLFSGFAVASVVLLALVVIRGPGPERRMSLALIAATGAAVVAPLSWFLIFKAHSHAHLHMNFIVWQMPFTFFGAAMCAAALDRLTAGCHRRFANLRSTDVSGAPS